MKTTILILTMITVFCASCIQTKDIKHTIMKYNHTNQTSYTDENNYIVVPVKIIRNGKTINAKFILDTGAPYTYFTKELSEKLDLQFEDKYLKGSSIMETNKGCSDGYKGQAAFRFFVDVVDSINILGNDSPPTPMFIAYGEISKEEYNGIDGLLGSDYLEKYGLKIDYKKHLILWG